MEYESQRQKAERLETEAASKKALAVRQRPLDRRYDCLALRINLLRDRRILGRKIIRVAEILCDNDMRTHGNGRGCELGDTTM